MPTLHVNQKTFLNNLVKNSKPLPPTQSRDSFFGHYSDKSRLSSKSNTILIGSPLKSPSSTARSTSFHQFKTSKVSSLDTDKLSGRSLTGRSKTTNRKNLPQTINEIDDKKQSNKHYEGSKMSNQAEKPSPNLMYRKFYPAEMFHPAKLKHPEENHSFRTGANFKVHSLVPPSGFKNLTTVSSARSSTKTAESTQNYRVKSSKFWME